MRRQIQIIFFRFYSAIIYVISDEKQTKYVQFRQKIDPENKLSFSE